MGAFTTTYDKIIRQPALTMPGNATGSEAACTALTASQIRTLLSIGTTSDVTFDIVRATTSVLSPLFNNPNAAATTLGNSTYGVTVPGALTVGGATTADAIINRDTGSGSLTWGLGIKYQSALKAGLDANVGTGEVRIGGLASSYYPVIYSNGAAALTFSTAGAATFSSTVSASRYGFTGWEFRPSTTAAGSMALYDTVNSRETLKLTPTGNAYFQNNVYLNATISGEAGIVLQQSGVSKWQVYDVGGRFDIYNYGTSANALSIAEATSNATFSGDISMQKATQGYIRAYATTGGYNAFIYHSGSEGIVDSSYGSLRLKGAYTILGPSTAISYCYTPGTNSQFQVYNINGQNGLTLSTDGTNAAISTFGGAGLTIAPAGGTVAVTGAVTASGGATITGGGVTGTGGLIYGSSHARSYDRVSPYYQVPARHEAV
jgi:hypothetical protein